MRKIPLRPRLRGRTTISRSDPSAGVIGVGNMLIGTGRRGFAPPTCAYLRGTSAEVLTPLSSIACIDHSYDSL